MLTALYVRARNWAQSDEGATALEYGILVALIALVITGGVLAFGNEIDAFFESIAVGAGAVTP
jgi:pilus assembly protein Flp/PilA